MCSHKKNSGSATVEASLILPIFIFALFAIYSFCGVLQTKAVVYESLVETAEFLAEYQYASETLGESSNAIVSTVANYTGTNIVTANVWLKKYLDDSDLVDKYVSLGTKGLIITRATYDEDDGFVYLTLRYTLTLSLPLVGKLRWAQVEKIKQKAYVGLIGTSGDDDDTYVYVTENKEVYHTSRSCYHIKLTISTITESELESNYSNYTACWYCARNKSCSGKVYIADTTTKYHYSISCSGLKRTVSRVKKSTVTDVPACSNCG